ncbi:hypothetical protein K0M31_012688 [Melipona bicolor]|uniref:Uncharacterized protein n=1 Tax=Melipona bicolor TaxID=60889 RepID=A0AA40FJB4_9HYME|nr:hypothetical protein K0M31_012688 [Melipona bicolor]
MPVAEERTFARTSGAGTCSEVAGKHVPQGDASQNGKIAVLQDYDDGISMIRGTVNAEDASRAREREI